MEPLCRSCGAAAAHFLRSDLHADGELELTRHVDDVANGVVHDRRTADDAVGTIVGDVVVVVRPVEQVQHVQSDIRIQVVPHLEVLGGLYVQVAIAKYLAADKELAGTWRNRTERL